MEQQLLSPSPSAQLPQPHQLNQLQRSSTSAVSDQEGIFSSTMDMSSSLVQDWVQPASDFNNLTSLGFDSMFQFNAQADPFPIDQTEFTSSEFGFSSGMTGPMSSIFDPATPNSLASNNPLVSSTSLENSTPVALIESGGFNGNSGGNHGDDDIGLALGQTTHTNTTRARNGSHGSVDNILLEQSAGVNLSHALKPHYIKSLKASAAAAASATTASIDSSGPSLSLVPDRHHHQGFNPVQIDLGSSEPGQLFSAPQQPPQASLLFQPQQPGPEQSFQTSQQAPSHHPFAFQHQQSFLQQPPQRSQLDEDSMAQQLAFGQARPLSMGEMMHQQQHFEGMLFPQQQQQQQQQQQPQNQLNSDMKSHFRHASSPNFSEVIKQEDSLRLQRHQMQLHHQQESLQLAQQQQQQQQQSIHPSSVHPFSTAPAISSKASTTSTRTLNKRPSDLHVDISRRSSSFRLNGDVRNGDFRFSSDGRDANDNTSAPLTPAFFTPAFAEALGSPGAILYQNSPFVLTSQDRSRASIQTDTSMGSFMDMHASSASSPSSLSSLTDSHRMFRTSTDSMPTPLENIAPMDITNNFGDLSDELGYLDKQDIASMPNSAGLRHRDSFCHSPDHVDPHSLEVRPSYFSTVYQDDIKHVKMEVMSTPEIEQDHTILKDGSAPETPMTPTESASSSSSSNSSNSGRGPPLKTARKRRSNEGVSCSPAASSPSSSSSPPRRSRTISTTSSLIDEKDDSADSHLANHYGQAASLKPIMLGRDLKPPSVKTMRTIIKQFLAAKTPARGGEKSVLILTSKVAQKSYGTEKRFLCPPPTTMLLGSNWWSGSLAGQSSDEGSGSNLPKMIVSICGETGGQQGTIEWTTKDDTAAPIITGKCVSKQLYINDADEKRKKVEVLVKFMMAGDVELGTFASKPIKVISKPSKKRQSIKNMELCIHHGTTISLFNRIRSQTVSTKYLGVSTTSQASAHAPWNYGSSNLRDWPSLEPSSDSANTVTGDGDTCFVARTSSWDPFVVWIVSPGQTRTESMQEHAQRHPGFPPPPAIAINSPPEGGPQTPIHYNQPIVLQCLSTGLVSPVMVIRKVDKGSMVLGGGSTGNTSAEYEQEALGDPVSQLHKVAFQITGQATPAGAFSQSKLQQGTYLACLGDMVGMQRANEGKRYLPDPKAPPSPTEEDDESIGENAKTSGNNPFSMDIVPEIPENTTVPEALMSAWAAGETDAVGSGPFAGEKTIVTTTDGQRVERKRRVSSSVVIKSAGCTTKAATKSRRRVQSLSVTQAEAQRIRASVLAANNQYQGNHIQAFPISAAASGGSELKEKPIKENAKVLAMHQQRRHSSIWTEDVTDAAVWTIVGTDCAQYNFCTPGGSESMSLPRSAVSVPRVGEVFLDGQVTGNKASSGPIFINSPAVTTNTTHSSTSHSSQSKSHGHGHGHSKSLRMMETHINSHGHHERMYHSRHSTVSHNNHGNESLFGAPSGTRVMTLKGQGFSRDLSVWFGTIKAPVTEYRAPESLVVHIPEEVSLGSAFYFTKDDDEDVEGDDEDEDDPATANGGGDDHHGATGPPRFRRKRVKGLFESDCVPILLVRNDGVIYRSGHSIALG